MDGVLVLDKPGGITSRKAAVRVARAAGASKSGHAGTLDPIATGVLLVCLDRATLLSRVLGGGSKQYEVEAVLGVETDTYDTEGEVLARKNASGIGDEAIRRAARSLTGAIRQTPPLFSAVKYEGRPLYFYARQGRTVPVRDRDVQVDAFDLVSVERLADGVTARLSVTCGPGTYVRSLVHSMGEMLGCGAVISGLRRTRSGRFAIEQAADLDDLADEATVRERLVSMERATDGMPTLIVAEAAAWAVRFGKKLSPESAASADFTPETAPSTFRVLDAAGWLLALYGPPVHEDDMGCYRARRVLRPADGGA